MVFTSVVESSTLPKWRYIIFKSIFIKYHTASVAYFCMHFCSTTKCSPESLCMHIIYCNAYSANSFLDKYHSRKTQIMNCVSVKFSSHKRWIKDGISGKVLLFWVTEIDIWFASQGPESQAREHVQIETLLKWHLMKIDDSKKVMYKM